MILGVFLYAQICYFEKQTNFKKCHFKPVFGVKYFDKPTDSKGLKALLKVIHNTLPFFVVFIGVSDHLGSEKRSNNALGRFSEWQR